MKHKSDSDTSHSWNPRNNPWPIRLGLQNALTASLQRGKAPPMSDLDMTLINLMDEASVMLELWRMTCSHSDFSESYMLLLV